MNSSECYKRAAQDAAYRRELLANLRLVKHLSFALIWLCVLVSVAFAVYGEVVGARVDNVLGVMLVAVFSWIPYLWCSSRIAALKALEGHDVPPVSAGPGDVGVAGH